MNIAGAIMALYAMTVVGLGPFGSLAAGAMAHHFGARLTVIAGGVLYLIAAAVFRAHMPVVRVAGGGALSAPSCLDPAAGSPRPAPQTAADGLPNRAPSSPRSIARSPN